MNTFIESKSFFLFMLKHFLLDPSSLLLLELKIFILKSCHSSITCSLLVSLQLYIFKCFEIICETLSNLYDFQTWMQRRSIKNLQNLKIRFETRLLGQLFLRAARSDRRSHSLPLLFGWSFLIFVKKCTLVVQNKRKPNHICILIQ